ncbi:imelysin family protein [Noviherbaspirillum saxi]|nr:imelysin family protein [Noviherbaspirillum saxi]
MQRTSFSLLLVMWLPLAYAAESRTELEEKLPKAALFQHLTDEVLLPLTDEFEAKARALSASTQAFCSASGRANVESVRTAWRQAQAAWQPLEMLQIGPIIDRRTQRQVNAWPLRPTLIDPILNSAGPIDPARVEDLGAAGKGLPALEYLLFPQGKSSAEVTTALQGNRCAVLQALAAQVAKEAHGLSSDWRDPNGGFARQLKEAGQHSQEGVFATTDQALSDIANLLIAGLDSVKVRKLGKLLEKSGDAIDSDRIESWRSASSLENIRNNLRGFEAVFFGRGQQGVGLDDYLAGIGRPVLPRLVREDLDTAMNALAAIRSPMPRALKEQRKQVESLHTAVTQLQRRMENDIADALKVDLGFNANDGD